MSDGADRRIAGGLTALWVLLGLGAATLYQLRAGGVPEFEAFATTVVSGTATGLLAGVATASLARAFRGLVAGALAGHLAMVAPAAQLGQWIAGLAAPWLGMFGLDWLRFAGYPAVFALVATPVLCAGAVLGVALEVSFRTLFPRLTAPPGWWRPRWRSLRIAVLLAALGGALWHADRKVGVPWPQADPPGRSSWLERERALFRDVVATGRYELIVLPVQATEPSFDRIARSLMTRYLAQRAEERTGFRMPDPTLLARALGARSRTLELDDALRFAGELGSGKVVVSHVKRTGASFELRASLWERAAPGGAWQEAASGALAALPFHDRLPPSVAVRASVDALLDQLRVGEPRPVPREAATAPAPQPLADLVRLAAAEDGAALTRALRLQILAALHEREGLEAETLWERSLVALSRADDSDELARLLEARAWLHLSRRPYALERLGAPVTPAAKALAAALDGDLPGLETAAAAISEPALRLLAEIELADLYDAYGVHKRLLARRKAVLEPAATQPTLLALRLSAPEWFRPEVHAQIADLIGELAPVGHSSTELAWAWLRWLYWRDDALGTNELDVARDVERALPALWRRQAADWAARRAADRPAPWDYYDLLFAANRTALLKTVYGTLHFHGMPQEAATVIDELGPLYQGWPRLMYYQAWALDRLGREAPRGRQQRLFSRSSALAASAYGWEGGESRLAQALEYYIYERPYRKYLDEPPRRYRVVVPAERLQFERTSFGPHEIQRSIREARRRLDYSDRDIEPLTQLVRWLRRAGETKEAATVIEANRHRFVGTLARAQLLSETHDMALPVYKELLAVDPDSWEARMRLARGHLESGAAGEAQRALLEFPGFADHSGQHLVGLSNRAFEAGEYLYRRGEAELARALFARSTELQTGSAREIHARELTAVMHGELESALRHARGQLERYGDGAASMRVMLYQHLLGHSDAAWQEFSGFASRFDYRPWTAAFVGHRLEGVEGRALEAWLEREKARDTTRDYLTNALRERHAFMLAFTDRKPDAEALEHVRRVARANNDSPFYPQLAEGYVALSRGEYAVAAAKLAGPHRDLYNISINRRESLNEWLPHLALAQARAGNPRAAEALLAEHLVNIGPDYDYLVARAWLEAAAGAHDKAAASLRLAFFRLPPPATRALAPGYTLLETAETLYAESGQELYRSVIEDVARRLQVEVPYSFAAAFEAKYAQAPEARELALAAASVLDPRSMRIAHFSEPERQAARRAALKQPRGIGLRTSVLHARPSKS